MGRAGRGAGHVLTAVLLLGIQQLEAGEVGTDFGAKLANPLINGFSGGKSLASSGLVPGFADGTWTEQLSDCNGTAGQSASCDYITWIAGCAAMGVVVCPMLAIIICCGFMCGRKCKVSCECCCKPCGESNCGGTLPTREYPMWERATVLGACLPILWISILCFSAVGFAAFQETSSEIDLGFDGARGIATATADLRVDINSKIDVVVARVKTEMQPLNDVFGRVGEIKASVGGLRSAMRGVESALSDLGKLVEGCDPGTASCVQTNQDNWQRCAVGQASVSQLGVAIDLSDNSGTNPTCKDSQTGLPRRCRCCTQCQDLLNVVSQVLTNIPTDAKIDEIDGSLPTSDLDQTVDDAVAEFRKPLDDIDSAVPISISDIDRIQNDLGDVNGAVSGINCAFWLPSWLCLIAILVALTMGRRGASQEHARIGDCCWWFAFTFAAIWFVIIICPLFGLASVVAIPLNDACEILPRRGGTSDGLVAIVRESDPGVDTTTLKTILDECLLPEGGYFWGVTDITRQSLAQSFDEYRPSNFITQAELDEALETLSYTNDFTAREAEFESFSTADFVSSPAAECPVGAYAGCTAEVEQYQADLTSKITAVADAARAALAARDSTNALSEEVLVQLKAALATADTLVDGLSDEIYELGRCTLLAEKYGGVSGPLCGLADIFTSVWACALIVAASWFFMFFAICLSSKRWYQIREGFEKPDNSPYHFNDIGSPEREFHAVRHDSLPRAVAHGEESTPVCVSVLPSPAKMPTPSAPPEYEL